MNITCVICGELFVTGVDIYFTNCGHVFHYQCLINWLERSKSCPQCRTKVTEKTIHKVYFNISNNEQRSDPADLLFQLENSNFSITLKDLEIKKLKEKNGTLKEQNRGLKQELKKTEESESALKSTLLTYKEQISFYKNKAKEADQLCEEIVKLKKIIKNMENVDTVLKGTREQVNDILRNDQDPESLALMGAILKKSLVDSEKRVRDLDYNLRKARNEYSKIKKEYGVLETHYADTKKTLEQLQLKNDREKNILKQRLKEANKNNAVVSNADLNLSKSVRNLDTMLEARNTSLSKDDNFLEARNTSQSKEDSFLNTTLSVNERIQAITNSDSPYLTLKTNLNPFLNATYNKPSTSTQSFGSTTFKSNQKSDNTKKGTNVIYDGLGGSGKADIYPTSKTKSKPPKRKASSAIPSNKFKKLAPSRSQTKLTDSLIID